MNSLLNLKHDLITVQTIGTENSFYPPICSFLKLLAEELNINNEIIAIAIANSSSHEKNVGFPDITVQMRRHTLQTIGWIEVKLPQDSLNDPKFEKQFNKYKNSLQNILFTNLREWKLYQWNDKNKPVLIKEVLFDIFSYEENNTDIKEITQLLKQFYLGIAVTTKSSKQLTVQLARRAKLLSEQVEETLILEEKENDPTGFLSKLKNSFETDLIADLSVHQFSNVIAETLTYSLLLAALEYQKKPVDQPFSLHSAYEYLPKNIPLLREMYQLTVKTAEKQETIKFAVLGIIEQLDNTDLKAIYSKLSNHLEDEDPIIHFYEPFLAEYDRDEKNNRGVFYTPKQVVDFIVRGVDHLLKTKLNKPQGLSTYSKEHPEESVHLLDPATGTGTFIMSAVQEVYKHHSNLKSLGEHIFKKQFEETVKKHILKHFFAFELMVAPYTIAHLKLTLELQRLGFDFESVYNDSDKDNDRLKIYLANTLDAPKELTDYHTQGFGSYFESITREVQDANKVKTQEPVLVIIGNPPYSVSSSNKGPWITELMNTYKKSVRTEKNIQPLSDDYIKFIRFAQWKIEQTGEGIVAMITNHSFLGGLIHRGMRQELMKTFDEIYVMDLHGNTTIGEKNPSGGIDQNVFPIKQGVCIFFFVKKKTHHEKTQVYHSELWGDKNMKLTTLNSLVFSDITWKRLEPEKTQNSFFIPVDSTVGSEYGEYINPTKIFNQYSSGVKTHRDNLVIDQDLISLKKRIEDFCDLNKNDQEIKARYDVSSNRDWDMSSKRKKMNRNYTTNNNYKKYLYKPFDFRWIYYDNEAIDFPRTEIMRNFFQPNLGLSLMRKIIPQHFNQIIVNSHMMDVNFFAFQSYTFPLYITSHNEQINFSNNSNVKKCNINIEFTEQFDRKLFPEKYSETNDLLDKMHEKKPEPTITPEQIFYYAYATFHSPTYRTRYAEELKIDFPRLPLTSNKDLFYKLVEKGNQLVNMHLLGENPFDESDTIFAHSEKWGVSMHIDNNGEHVSEDKKYLVTKVMYDPTGNRIYFNDYAYFEGVEKDVWEFYIGGYQVLDKWLKERKKHNRSLSTDDMMHFMKVVVSLRETIKLMKEIDDLIPEWPMK